MTRDQERATSAHTRVKKFGEDNPNKPERDKYGSMAHKLPVLIRSSGLAQALVFVEARGKPQHRELLEHIAATAKYTNTEKLLEQSRTTDLLAYMHLTREVLAICLWYKRFSQSLLDADGTGEG